MLKDITDAMTATKLSKSTLYALIRSGELESVKVGSRRLFTDEQLTRFVGGLSPAHPSETAARTIAADYTRQRVEETCASQGLALKPDDAVLDTVAAILGNVEAVSRPREVA